MRNNVSIPDCQLQVACKTVPSTSFSVLGVVHYGESAGKRPYFI
jgi:hypothetical protein